MEDETRWTFERIIFFSIANGSNGYISHFAKPASFVQWMFDNASKFLLVTTKLFLENERALTAFPNESFRDLKTALSEVGVHVWCVCVGGGGVFLVTEINHINVDVSFVAISNLNAQEQHKITQYLSIQNHFWHIGHIPDHQNNTVLPGMILNYHCWVRYVVSSRSTTHKSYMFTCCI